MTSPRPLPDVRPRTLAVSAALTVAAGLLAGCGSAASGAPAAASSVPPTVSGAPASAAATPSTEPTEPATGQATPAAAAAGDTTACALVTEQEVAAVLGSDPGAGQAFTSHGASQCQYGSYATSFVLVNLTPTQGKAAYDLMHGRSNPGGVMVLSDVSGLGDRAFQLLGPHTASMYIDKGDAMVLVMVEIRTAAAPPKTQVLALARTAADRL